MASLVWQFFVGPIIGLAMGGFPTAFIVSKLVAGIDPRKFGSGSVSTRNTIRAAGFWPWGAIVGTTDFLKGAAACAIVEFTFGWSHPNVDYIVVLTGLAAIAGHCWMPYLGFKGGKGLATMAGVTVFFYWPIGLLIFPILIGLLSLLSGFSGIGAVWGVSFISPLFFLIDEIGPPMFRALFIPHDLTFLADNLYGFAFSLLYGLGVLLIILLRHLPEFKKIKSGDAEVWSKLTRKDMMK